MDSRLSIVIPVYNEEENLIPLYNELTDVIKGNTHEIIFIDDGSTDRTPEQLKKIHKDDPRVTIITFRSNFGQSAAMRAGFDHAKGDLIITMDADLQNDPHDIPQLLAMREEQDLDIICGWRQNRHDPVFKKLCSRFANTIRRSLTGELIHDSGCTLRVYSRESIEDLELYGELHRYIPALLLWKGYHVGEMKTTHRERAYGKTKYTWHRIIKGALDLLVITFWQKYSVRPMHVFGGSGLVIGGLGVITALYLGVARLFFGMGLTERPLFTVSLVMIILGMQFIALGIIADILLKIYYGQGNRKTYLIKRIDKKTADETYSP